IRDYKVTGVQTCALPISKFAAAKAAACTLARVFERLDEIFARGLQRGHEAERDCGQHRDPEAEEEHGRVEMDDRFLGNRAVGDEIGRASCRERVEMYVVG